MTTNTEFKPPETWEEMRPLAARPFLAIHIERLPNGNAFVTAGRMCSVSGEFSDMDRLIASVADNVREFLSLTEPPK